MKVEVLAVGQLGTNCYLAHSQGETVIIDPGDDADFIIRRIKDLELAPQAIIATHAHFDHILAATELKLAFKIPFWLHKDDQFLLKRMGRTAKHFTGLTVDPAPKFDSSLEEGQIIKVGKEKLTVIHTPGHTPGSISLVGKGLVFVGDLLFAGGAVGRTDLEGGNKQLLDRSIKKILRLPEDTIIYSGHGEATSVDEELSYHK